VNLSNILNTSYKAINAVLFLFGFPLITFALGLLVCFFKLYSFELQVVKADYKGERIIFSAFMKVLWKLLFKILLGPFYWWHKSKKVTLLLLFLIILLTLFTQFGGILLWLSLQFIYVFGNKFKKLRIAVFLLSFVGFYLFTLVFAVLPLAVLGGRVSLPWFSSQNTPLKPVNPFIYLCARNYVRPELKELLVLTAKKMNQKYPGTITYYLDASFPFFDYFPLLPHLSHDDGKKVDLAFFYVNGKGKQLKKARSYIGYWAYEKPQKGETAKHMGKKSYLRWNFTWLQRFFPDSKFDVKRMKSLTEYLIQSSRQVDDVTSVRIIIEDYLKERLINNGLENRYYKSIGFQQLNAARHDDHLHLQIKINENLSHHKSSNNVTTPEVKATYEFLNPILFLAHLI